MLFEESWGKPGWKDSLLWKSDSLRSIDIIIYGELDILSGSIETLYIGKKLLQLQSSASSGGFFFVLDVEKKNLAQFAYLSFLFIVFCVLFCFKAWTSKQVIIYV